MEVERGDERGDTSGDTLRCKLGKRTRGDACGALACVAVPGFFSPCLAEGSHAKSNHSPCLFMLLLFLSGLEKIVRCFELEISSRK